MLKSWQKLLRSLTLKSRVPLRRNKSLKQLKLCRVIKSKMETQVRSCFKMKIALFKLTLLWLKYPWNQLQDPNKSISHTLLIPRTTIQECAFLSKIPQEISRMNSQRLRSLVLLRLLVTISSRRITDNSRKRESFYRSMINFWQI